MWRTGDLPTASKSRSNDQTSIRHSAHTHSHSIPSITGLLSSIAAIMGDGSRKYGLLQDLLLLGVAVGASVIVATR
jgi:hypothetical protein